MPQMAPMNWMSLYFMFIMVFLLFIILNYYSFFYQPKISKSKKQTTPINWKW